MGRKLISQSEYARLRGCARSSVYKAVQTGRIRLDDGKVNPAKADREWANNTKARADSGPAKPLQHGLAASLEYSGARERRARCDAERAELEAGKMSGRLLNRAQVEAATFEAFHALRDRFMNAPRRAASLVVSLADVKAVEAAIAAELIDAMGGSDEQALAGLRSRIFR